MGGPVADEIILCSLKVLYIVCYIANVPVCVLCDGRTGARTILFCRRGRRKKEGRRRKRWCLRPTDNPTLSGIRCFLRRNATTQQRRNANSQIIVLIEKSKINHVIMSSCHHHHLIIIIITKRPAHRDVDECPARPTHSRNARLSFYAS